MRPPSGMETASAMLMFSLYVMPLLSAVHAAEGNQHGSALVCRSRDCTGREWREGYISDNFFQCFAFCGGSYTFRHAVS